MDWEKDRTRKNVSKVIENESRTYHQRQKELARHQKEERIRYREGLRSEDKWRTRSDSLDFSKLVSMVESGKDLHSLVPDVVTRNNTIRVSRTGRLLPISALGQYLLDAARLYEGMLTFQDQRIVEKYLHRNPPLHPRRTLDQFRHPTLKSTEVRDRDQVVYRGTSDRSDLRHHTGVPAPLLRKRGKIRVILDLMLESIAQRIRRRGADESYWEWDRLWAGHPQNYEHCTAEIKKTSKLIMVDQLWMWVLDEHTLITSFPGRYGDDQHLDGIHKSIRNQLRNTQVRSVFELALVVLSECSTTFFDRTRIDVSGSSMLGCPLSLS